MKKCTKGLGLRRGTRGTATSILLHRTKDSTIMARQLGPKKRASRVTQRYYKPGVGEDVAKLCRECQHHQIHSEQTLETQGACDTSTKSGETIHPDSQRLVGALPMSMSGHRFIETLINYCRRYPKSILLNYSQTSAEVQISMKR